MRENCVQKTKTSVTYDGILYANWKEKRKKEKRFRDNDPFIVTIYHT